MKVNLQSNPAAILYPIKLSYVPKSAVWGGKKLLSEFGKETPYENLAETWELSVREHENSVAENGVYAGKSLGEILKLFGNTALGEDFHGEKFPLLVKLIDAAEDLSLQVHPDDRYAAAVEGENGKTELWHIVSAAEDASILYGFEGDCSVKDFSDAAARGNLPAGIRKCPVRAGETYFIPAGLPHAIGKGVLVAEVQQNCDLTYRIFDYNRTDKNGHPRELHLAKAMAVIRSFTDEEIDGIRFAKGDRTALASCPYFTVRRADFLQEYRGVVGYDTFVHLLFLDGTGEILHSGQHDPFVKGDSYFLPAGLGPYLLRGHGSVLITSL